MNRMTAKDIIDMGHGHLLSKGGADTDLPKAQKYHAKPTVYNGVRYASRAEAARASDLDLHIKTGDVRWWIGQVKFRLGVPENVYVADFLVMIRLGGVHVEDVKGAMTAKFKRDVRLWRVYGPMTLRVLSKKGKGWDWFDVIPDRVAERKAGE